MGFVLAQGGNTLYKVDPATGVATVLALPAGVTLDTTRKPKFAILDQFVAIVNSPSRNLVVDPEGVARVMMPIQPFSPPFLAVGGGTGYTGSRTVRCSFVVKDSVGNLIMESALSPQSISVAFANQNMSMTRIPISPDAVSARRIYTTLTGGTVFYQLMDVDDNTATTALSNVTDAQLSLLPVMSSVLVAPPGTFTGTRMKNIVSWKSRMWGVGTDPSLVDTVLYSESRKLYAWPNQLTAYPTGQNTAGIVAFAPRRDQLGVLKRDGLWQISGSASGSSGIANPALVQVVYGKAGCIAEDSVVTVNDKVYWLGNDGVYEWGPNGVDCISDDKVMPWFQSDTYFNRARFPYAFAKYNQLQDQYELHLANAGDSTENRWVAFNLTKRAWYGPHKTDAYTPSHAALCLDANGLPMSVIGGTDGVIYAQNQATFRDGAATAIDMDCDGPFHSANAPDIEHHWGHLSMLTKVEAAGTLTVTPKVGRLNAAAGSALTHDLTKGRQQLGILGDGPLLQLRIRQADVNQGAVVYGYEVDEVFENGRR